MCISFMYGRNRFDLAPYVDRLHLIHLETLHRRRYNACAFFMFDLYNYRIDSSISFSLLNVNASSISLRYMKKFQLSAHRTNYGRFDTVALQKDKVFLKMN